MHIQEKVATSSYIDLRTIFLKVLLKQGRYVLIPTTFSPGVETEFLLRLFTDVPSGLRYLAWMAPPLAVLLPSPNPLDLPCSGSDVAVLHQFNQKFIERWWRNQISKILQEESVGWMRTIVLLTFLWDDSFMLSVLFWATDSCLQRPFSIHSCIFSIGSQPLPLPHVFLYVINFKVMLTYRCFHPP